MITTIFVLLIVYQLKHFLADYPLQGKYMLGKFSKDPNVWIPALIAHAGVHAIFTWTIVQWAQWAIYGHPNVFLSIALACLDFVIHFTMDRIKASPSILGRFKPDNKFFWWALGFDQMIHHLTHYLIIYLLLF